MSNNLAMMALAAGLCVLSRAWKFKQLYLTKADLKGVDEEGDSRSFRLVHVGCCGLATFCRTLFQSMLFAGIMIAEDAWLHCKFGSAFFTDDLWQEFVIFLVSTMVCEIREEGRALGKDRKALRAELSEARAVRSRLRKIDSSVSYGVASGIEGFYDGLGKLLDSADEYNRTQDKRGEGMDGDIIIRYMAVYDNRMRMFWLVQTVLNAIVAVAVARLLLK